MYRNNGVYFLFAFVIGMLFGWWLANKPINDLDDAFRDRLDNLGANFGTSGLLLIVIILLIVLIAKR